MLQILILTIFTICNSFFSDSKYPILLFPTFCLPFFLSALHPWATPSRWATTLFSLENHLPNTPAKQPETTSTFSVVLLAWTLASVLRARIPPSTYSWRTQGGPWKSPPPPLSSESGGWLRKKNEFVFSLQKNFLLSFSVIYWKITMVSLPCFLNLVDHYSVFCCWQSLFSFFYVDDFWSNFLKFVPFFFIG